MKSKILRVTAVTAAVMMLFSLLAACGGSKEQPSATTAGNAGSTTATEKVQEPLDKVELNFYLLGDEPNDMQSVLAEVESRTKDTINVKPVFTFINFADYANKIKVLLSVNEPVDSVFDAPWLQMPAMIGKDTYVKLDAYFNNDKFPGLKAAFPSNLIDNNMFVDSTNEAHVYGIPLTTGFGENLRCFMIRKDLREKYGLGPIQSLADLEAYFAKVLENENGKIIPFTAASAYDYSIRSTDEILQGVWEFGVSTWYLGYAIKDGVCETFVLGEDTTGLMPEALSGNDYWTPVKTIRQWYQNGFVEKDVMNQKDTMGAFTSGKVASIIGDPTQFAVAQPAVKAMGGDVELFVFNDRMRNFEKGAIPTTFQAWNYSCIPVSSKNAERTMLFYDWIFSSKENHDLIEYGIQGKHWEPIGEYKYKVPEGTDAAMNYTFPGYLMTWSPSMVRYADTLPDEVVKINNYTADVENCVKVPTAGFSFNTEPVKTEIAKISPIYQQYMMPARYGVVDMSDPAVKSAIDKMNAVGLDKVKTEFKKQMEEWLKNQ